MWFAFSVFCKEQNCSWFILLDDSVPRAAHLGTVLLNLISSETENRFPSDVEFFFPFFLPI